MTDAGNHDSATASPAAEPIETPAPGAGAPTPPSGAEDRWTGAIEDGRVRRFAERFESPAELARSAFELRQKLSNAVVLPGPNADAADRRQFQRKLGVPARPEGYDLKLPAEMTQVCEADPAAAARLADFKRAMHAAGATPAAAQAGVDWYAQAVAVAQAEQDRAQADAREEAEATLRRDWGAEYDGNLRLAQRAAATFGDEAFTELLETATAGKTRLGNHPAFLRIFAAIGRRMAEDGDHSAAGDAARNTVQSRIDELTDLMHSDPDRYKTRAVQEELTGLYARLHGTGAISDPEGRSALR